MAGHRSGRDRKPHRTAEKKQRACYSGKKKRHTLKSQVAIDKATGTILAAACGKGREHDFRLFKRSKLRPHPSTELLADSGYQGLTKRHPNSRTPHKRRRKTIALTPEQPAHNRALASERVLAENVIRRLKVFPVLKETYRHRRKRFSLRVHLLAGLYNHDLKTTS
jgi:DDE superfamily endonuclease